MFSFRTPQGRGKNGTFMKLISIISTAYCAEQSHQNCQKRILIIVTWRGKKKCNFTPASYFQDKVWKISKYNTQLPFSLIYRDSSLRNRSQNAVLLCYFSKNRKLNIRTVCWHRAPASTNQTISRANLTSCFCWTLYLPLCLYPYNAIFFSWHPGNKFPSQIKIAVRIILLSIN